MISKEKFVEIINRLKETDKLKRDIDELLKNSTDNIVNDFCNASSLMICHEDIVVELLNNIFDNYEDISYFIYELEYGEKYKKGCITFKNIDIDISNAEKLYDYLTKNKDK